MKRGFTLVELLVVVAIIVVLLALLLPGMDRAINIAASAKCCATLHGWGLGMRQYALDNKGSAILLIVSRGQNWWGRLAPYMGQPGYDNPTDTTTNIGALAANSCPETRPNTSGGLGSAENRWLLSNSEGSYGINTWVAKAPGYNESFPGGNFYSRYGDAPGDTPLLADSIWVNSWPDNTDAPTSDTYNGDNTQPGMNRFVIARHNLTGKAINTVFVDGSARNVKLGELWTLRWHKNSEPNSNHLKYFEP